MSDDEVTALTAAYQNICVHHAQLLYRYYEESRQSWGDGFLVIQIPSAALNDRYLRNVDITYLSKTRDRERWNGVARLYPLSIQHATRCPRNAFPLMVVMLSPEGRTYAQAGTVRRDAAESHKDWSPRDPKFRLLTGSRVEWHNGALALFVPSYRVSSN